MYQMIRRDVNVMGGDEASRPPIGVYGLHMKE